MHDLWNFQRVQRVALAPKLTLVVKYLVCFFSTVRLYLIAGSRQLPGRLRPIQALNTMTTPPRHDARGVANAILDYAATKDIALTPMQVIKLVYLCHGWSLALHDGPMIDNQPQAWQYGPVYPHIYKAFKQFGSRPISGRARSRETGFPYEAKLTDDQRKLMHEVVDGYGHLKAFQLSNLTHQVGTPWQISYNAGAYSQISDELMKAHFEKLYDVRSTGTA